MLLANQIEQACDAHPGFKASKGRGQIPGQFRHAGFEGLGVVVSVKIRVIAFQRLQGLLQVFYELFFCYVCWPGLGKAIQCMGGGKGETQNQEICG